MLLEKRGKQDFAIRIHHKTAAARGVLPYGPHGPAIYGFGAQHFDDGYSRGYSGEYDEEEDEYYSDGRDRGYDRDEPRYDEDEPVADERYEEDRYRYEEERDYRGFGGYHRYPSYGRPYGRRPYGRRGPPRRYREDRYEEEEEYSSPDLPADESESADESVYNRATSARRKSHSSSYYDDEYEGGSCGRRRGYYGHGPYGRRYGFPGYYQNHRYGSPYGQYGGHQGSYGSPYGRGVTYQRQLSGGHHGQGYVQQHGARHLGHHN